jgi:hypothetical protein
MAIKKIDPIRYCWWCKGNLERKRFSTGRLEDRGIFLHRIYCNRECQRHAQVKPQSVNTQTLLSRSQKFRKKECERCGRTNDLHVHHKNKNRMDSTPENLETLCVWCHNQHHAMERRNNVLGVRRATRWSPQVVQRVGALILGAENACTGND